MTDIVIQWIITAAIVALAAYFLLRHLLQLGRPDSGSACGSGCSACSQQELLEKRLASLDEG